MLERKPVVGDYILWPAGVDAIAVQGNYLIARDAEPLQLDPATLQLELVQEVNEKRMLTFDILFGRRRTQRNLNWAMGDFSPEKLEDLGPESREEMRQIRFATPEEIRVGLEQALAFAKRNHELLLADAWTSRESIQLISALRQEMDAPVTA